MHWRQIFGHMCQMLMLTTVFGWTVAPSHANAADCGDVELAFSRGTNEPTGVGATGEAFATSLRTKLTSKTLNIYAVQYPAEGPHIASVQAGAADLSAHVHEVAQRCPRAKIILGGWSQGAAVTDAVTAAPTEMTLPVVGADGSFSYGSVPGGDPRTVFETPINPADRQHVSAIALFGDPAQRLYNGPPPLLDGFRDGITIDLCNGDDPVCHTVPSADIATGLFQYHLTYPSTDLPGQAADFVVNKIR